MLSDSKRRTSSTADGRRQADRELGGFFASEAFIELLQGALFTINTRRGTVAMGHKDGNNDGNLPEKDMLAERAKHAKDRAERNRAVAASYQLNRKKPQQGSQGGNTPALPPPPPSRLPWMDQARPLAPVIDIRSGKPLAQGPAGPSAGGCSSCPPEPCCPH
jgi:hypothetical protein